MNRARAGKDVCVMDHMTATPILDGLRDMPRRRKGTLGRPLRSMLFFVWIFGVMWLLLETQPNLPELPPLPIWFAAYLAAAYLSVAVHEAGHAVAAICMGLRLISIRIWPFTLAFTGRWLTFDWKGRMGLTRVRTDDEAAYLKRRIPFLIGGVIGNALATAIGLAFLFVNRGLLANAHPIAAAFFVGLVMVSSYYVVANLLPVETAQMTTDGAQLLDALRGSPKRARDQALARLELALANGAAPRDFDRSNLELATSVADGSAAELRARMLFYAHLADRDEIGPPTAAHLERALETSAIANDLVRGGCAVAAAIFLGWYRGDVNGARRWVAYLRALPKSEALTEASADILMRCMDGDRDGALERCDALIAAAQSGKPSKTMNIYLHEMRKWRDEIASRLPLAESSA